MKVTIVTPSFNQGRFIRQTIESVLSQDYEDLEYIVVDGASTDGTLEILQEYDGRLKWISEPDEGQSDAINKGFKMATGDIVAWLNSDDTYEPGAVSAVISYFEQNPEVVLIYGEGNIIDEEGKKLHRFSATIPFNLWALVHVWDYILQPATFFRKEALENVDYLNKELHWTMDWDLWLKLSTKYDVLYINEYLANSREYSDTKTSTGGLARIEEIRKLMSDYSGMYYTEGFWLYYYDWLSKCFSDPDMQVAVTRPSMEFLKNLPIPGERNLCPPTTRFCMRKDLTDQTLEFVNIGNETLSVDVIINCVIARQIILHGKESKEIEFDFTMYSRYNNFNCVEIKHLPNLKTNVLKISVSQ
jgi:cellulose synthase/poly-beta-1,6-N-acetylglucosamine synthase-like glycosyltransferase